jgi:hypothetical protein
MRHLQFPVMLSKTITPCAGPPSHTAIFTEQLSFLQTGRVIAIWTASDFAIRESFVSCGAIGQIDNPVAQMRQAVIVAILPVQRNTASTCFGCSPRQLFHYQCRPVTTHDADQPPIPKQAVSFAMIALGARLRTWNPLAANTTFIPFNKLARTENDGRLLCLAQPGLGASDFIQIQLHGILPHSLH